MLQKKKSLHPLGKQEKTEIKVETLPEKSLEGTIVEFKDE